MSKINQIRENYTRWNAESKYKDFSRFSQALKEKCEQKFQVFQMAY